MTLDPSLARVLIVAARWRRKVDTEISLVQALQALCEEAGVELHPRQIRKLLEKPPC